MDTLGSTHKEHVPTKKNIYYILDDLGVEHVEGSPHTESIDLKTVS